MDLKQLLRHERPNITDSSIKTYTSTLTGIFKKCYPDLKIDTMCIEKFNDFDHVYKYLKELPINQRKTKLAALVVLTSNNEYSKKMCEDNAEMHQTSLKQEKNDKQVEGMISMDELKNIFNQVETHAVMCMKKTKLSPADYSAIQKYILLCLCSGIFIPPRRSADWNMKWKDFDAEKDNHIDVKNSQFIFNAYKTVKIYGQCKVPIPKPLKLILNKWFKIAQCEYVLYDSKLKPLSSSQITHRLNEIFGKKISTSMIRHIYLTHKFGNVNLQELNDIASEMGTSKVEALQYVKH
jgi:integrase